MRIAFLVSYVGTGFSGSQQQPCVRTVEGEIIRSCLSLGLFFDWRDAGFQFSGRTDSGVHARSQICTFDTDCPERAVSYINRKLPGDIWCRGWAEVPAGYNPRYEVSSRTYRYFFPDTALDTGKMTVAAEYLPGRHNFSRFARIYGGKDPERDISSVEITHGKDGVVLEICGRSFLWHMVRCISYALWQVGEGSAPPEMIQEALSNPGGPRFPVAPAGGLILWDIETETDFSIMDDLEKSNNYLKDFRGRHLQLKKASDLLEE